MFACLFSFTCPIKRLLVTVPKGHWSDGCCCRRRYRIEKGGRELCINSVLVRDYEVSLNLRRGVKPEKNKHNLKMMG